MKWTIWYLEWCIWHFHHKTCQDLCLHSLDKPFIGSKCVWKVWPSGQPIQIPSTYFQKYLKASNNTLTGQGRVFFLCQVHLAFDRGLRLELEQTLNADAMKTFSDRIEHKHIKRAGKPAHTCVDVGNSQQSSLKINVHKNLKIRFQI